MKFNILNSKDGFMIYFIDNKDKNKSIISYYFNSNFSEICYREIINKALFVIHREDGPAIIQFDKDKNMVYSTYCVDNKLIE